MREFIERNSVNSVEKFVRATSAALTFGEQAVVYIEQLKSRNRRPIRRKTLECYQNALDTHLVPLIGDVPLADVNNSVFKHVVATMVTKRHSIKKECPKGKPYSPETINTITKVMKEVVESLLDENGEPIYPRKWNNDFADLPIIHRSEQKRPSMTVAELEQGLARSKSGKRHLFALLAVTGLRISEALGLEARHVSSDGLLIQVRQTLDGTNIQQVTKTENGKRDVDIAPEFAAVLARFAASHPGFLFATSTGRPMTQRNALRYMAAKFGPGGFHRLRRFRTERLREGGAPRFLENHWLGWTASDDRAGMGDLYGRGLLDNDAYKREFAAKIGVGFSLAAFQEPQLGQLGQSSTEETETELAVVNCGS